MLQRWLKKTKQEEPVIPTKIQDSTPIPTISNEQPTKKKQSTKTEWTELSLQHFVKYKWMSKKEDGLFIWKFCTTFPKISKPSENFVKGWSGTANGFKFEAFFRHEQKNFHKDCKVEWEKSNGAATNKTAPEVSTWAAKLPDTFRDELCTRYWSPNATKGTISAVIQVCVLEYFCWRQPLVRWCALHPR